MAEKNGKLKNVEKSSFGIFPKKIVKLYKNEKNNFLLMLGRRCGKLARIILFCLKIIQNIRRHRKPTCKCSSVFYQLQAI